MLHPIQSEMKGLPAEAVELIEAARPFVGKMSLGRKDFSAGSVAAAIRSKSGHIYTGVCVHVTCGLGFCAEHAAVAEMLKGRETEIEMVVAIDDDGLLAPCGRCRELMVQINRANFGAKVIMSGGSILTLRELLPMHWIVD